MFSPNTSISSIINDIKIIRNDHNSIAFYGSPTGSNWLGIKNATTGIFPNNSIEIPQVYSNANISVKDQNKICSELVKLDFKKVIISGFANYFFDWIDLLHKNIDVEIIYHGTISEFHDNNTQQFISKIINYSKKNKISSLGFIKADLDNIFKKLYDINCHHQPLNEPNIPSNIKKIQLDNSKIHIGVFGSNTFNKNIHNQVIHALMLEKSIIHVLDKSIFKYLNMDDRIIEHGKNLNAIVFLEILGSMDLNLYMSYSESWGLIQYESEKMGVPCLTIDKINYISIIKNAITKF